MDQVRQICTELDKYLCHDSGDVGLHIQKGLQADAHNPLDQWHFMFIIFLM